MGVRFSNRASAASEIPRAACVPECIEGIRESVADLGPVAHGEEDGPRQVVGLGQLGVSVGGRDPEAVGEGEAGDDLRATSAQSEGIVASGVGIPACVCGMVGDVSEGGGESEGRGRADLAHGLAVGDVKVAVNVTAHTLAAHPVEASGGTECHGPRREDALNLGALGMTAHVTSTAPNGARVA